MLGKLLINPFEDDEPKDVGHWTFLIGVTAVVGFYPELFMYIFLGVKGMESTVNIFGWQAKAWQLQMMIPWFLMMAGMFISAEISAYRQND